MPIVKTQGYQLDSPQQNFVRDSFPTLADMLAYDTAMLPPVFHSMVDEDGKLYTYWENNEVDPVLGKWRLGAGGCQGGDTLNVDELPDPSSCQEGDVVNLRQDLDTCDDPAKLLLGGGWHIATYDEAYQLLAGISWSGLENYNVMYVEHDFGTKGGVNVTLRLDKTIRASKNYTSISGIVIGTSELTYRPERGFVDESYTVDGFIETYYYYAGSAPRREFWEITDDPYIATVGEDNSYWDKRTKTINYIAVLKDGDDPGPSYQDDYHFWHDSEHGYTIYMTPFKTRWGCEYGDDRSTTYKWSNPDYNPSEHGSEQFIKYGLNYSPSPTVLSTIGGNEKTPNGLYKLLNNEWVHLDSIKICDNGKQDIEIPNKETIYFFDDVYCKTNDKIDTGDPATLVNPLCRSIRYEEFRLIGNNFVNAAYPDVINIPGYGASERYLVETINSGISQGRKIYFTSVEFKEGSEIEKPSGYSEGLFLLKDGFREDIDLINVGVIADDDYYIDLQDRWKGFSCRAVVDEKYYKYLPENLKDQFVYLPSANIYMYILPVGATIQSGYDINDVQNGFGFLFQVGDIENKTDRVKECTIHTYKYYDDEENCYTQYISSLSNINDNFLHELYSPSVKVESLWKYNGSSFVPVNSDSSKYNEPLSEDEGGTGSRSLKEFASKVWSTLRDMFRDRSINDSTSIVVTDNSSSGTIGINSLWNYIRGKIEALGQLLLETTSNSERSIGLKNSVGKVQLRLTDTYNGLYESLAAKWLLRIANNTGTGDVYTDYDRFNIGQSANNNEHRCSVINGLGQIDLLVNSNGNMGLYDRTNNTWLIRKSVTSTSTTSANEITFGPPTVTVGSTSASGDVQYRVAHSQGIASLKITSTRKGLFDETENKWMLFSTAASTDTLIQSDYNIFELYENSTNQMRFRAKNSANDVDLIANSDGSVGVYAPTEGKWIVKKVKGENKTRVLDTNVGSSTTPIYINANGQFTACAASISGPTYYTHRITIGGATNNTSIRCTIINKSSTAYTFATLATYLANKFNSSTKAIEASGWYYPGNYAVIMGLYGTVESGTNCIYIIFRMINSSTSDAQDKFAKLSNSIPVTDTVLAIS